MAHVGLSFESGPGGVLAAESPGDTAALVQKGQSAMETCPLPQARSDRQGRRCWPRPVLVLPLICVPSPTAQLRGTGAGIPAAAAAFPRTRGPWRCLTLTADLARPWGLPSHLRAPRAPSRPGRGLPGAPKPMAGAGTGCARITRDGAWMSVHLLHISQFIPPGLGPKGGPVSLGPVALRGLGVAPVPS